jgi:CRISPR/Cas system endoribonuclease Cas6 (RAMP superfamily)
MERSTVRLVSKISVSPHDDTIEQWAMNDSALWFHNTLLSQHKFFQKQCKKHEGRKTLWAPTIEHMSTRNAIATHASRSQSKLLQTPNQQTKEERSE